MYTGELISDQVAPNNGARATNKQLGPKTQGLADTNKGDWPTNKREGL